MTLDGLKGAVGNETMDRLLKISLKSDSKGGVRAGCYVFLLLTRIGLAFYT